MMITPLYAGLLTLWYIVLTARIMHARSGGGNTPDDRGNPLLMPKLAARENFTEYVPLALLLMLVLELSRFSIYVLHALGIVLVIARLLHGYALSFAPHSKFGRVGGAAMTLGVLLVESVLCLYQTIQAHRVWFSI